jgi:DNA polymerase I-like protein with 3'-5' exonuclease and polymerase domains
MQNMPRGGTFPVKKVFISRWEGGKILEADFAQLEFRTAAYLSQDKTAMKEIEDGFDVHSYTAKVISESGQKTTRQEAKAHTFAPLYGATGFGRTPAEATYYKQFTQKYKGISLWHSKLAEEAMSTRKITTPSGREFSFPFVERRSNGSVTFFTQIKNFPVQSFATADIVPVVLLDIEKQLDKLQSCIVNTVHDSIVIDVHPNEEQDVINVIKNTNSNLKDIIDSQFNINLNVPLELEAKIGNNWLDTKDIA